MTTDERICQLVDYGVAKGLIGTEDRVYAANRILEVMGLDSFEPAEGKKDDGKEHGDFDKAANSALGITPPLEEILKDLVDDALSRELTEDDSIVSRDLFDTKLMGCLVPMPSQVINKFWELYKESPQAATDFYYEFSQATDYIRTYRVVKDMKWVTKTEYGDLDITINLSKPEKDPKAIAAARKAKASSYPKCLLCRENEGYAGRMNHPARQNHRIIPLTMNSQPWFLQYSPYVYYNEHCIAFNGAHVPMKIDRSTFVKLFDFVKLFPHYFIGSNADLPIVGGSILTHDHFQGGHYEFAMAKAPVETNIVFKGFEDVDAGIVKWPMSVIRISGKDSERLIDLADKILTCWRGYTDEAAYIFSETDGEPHNTITPIARMRGGRFELDLVLRNNITTKEHPDGLFHPHEEYHHIKKENIGLIEVMGLAVLPARLKTEMAMLKACILSGQDVAKEEAIEKHARWAKMLIEKYPDMNEDTIDEIIQKEIGFVYAAILEQCGVYKRDEAGRAAFLRFAKAVNG